MLEGDKITDLPLEKSRKSMQREVIPWVHGEHFKEQTELPF